MANAGTIVVRFTGDLSGLTNAISRGQTSINKAAKQLNSIGTKLSKNITAPILAIGGAAAKAFASFESELIGVAKTVDATDAQIEQLGKSFMDLSEATGVARGDIAAVAAAAGQLGIATENIESFTETMTALGVATNLSGEEAATTLARFANITGMAQTDFDRLGSTIVDLGNNFATTEAEIAMMAQRLAGAGTQIGLSESDILGISTALSSVGIQAEAGGTAFSRVMSDIAVEVGTQGENLAEFARIAGMSSKEFSKAFEEDSAGALVAFVEGLNRVSNEGENVFAVLEGLNLGNVRVRDALLRASGAGDLLREALERGSKAWEENTALTKEAEQFYASITQRSKGLWEQVKNIAASFGQALQPQIESTISFMGGLLDKIESLVSWFSNFSQPVKNMITTMVGLLAAVGPVTMAFGALAAVVGAISLPVVAVIGAIGLLVGAITALKTGVINGSQLLEGLGLSFDALIMTVRDAVSVFVALMTNLGAAIALPFEIGFNVIKNFASAWKQVFSGLAESVRGLFQILTGDFKEGWKTLTAGLSQFTDDFGNTFKESLTKGAQDAINNYNSRLVSADFSKSNQAWEEAGKVIAGAFKNGLKSEQPENAFAESTEQIKQTALETNEALKEMIPTQTWKEKLDEFSVSFQEKMLETLTNISDIIGQVSNAVQGFTQAQVNNVKKATNEEVKAAQKSAEVRIESVKQAVAQGVLTEDEGAIQIAAIQEGLAAEVSNIQTKGAQKEAALKRKMKPILIAEAIANTAVAVTKALPNFILAAAVGAAGAAQVAQIASQQYEQGGLVTGVGEINIPGSTDSIPAVLTPGEFVITKSATRKNKPLLEKLNKNPNYLGDFVDRIDLNESNIGNLAKNISNLNEITDDLQLQINNLTRDFEQIKYQLNETTIPMEFLNSFIRLKFNKLNPIGEFQSGGLVGNITSAPTTSFSSPNIRPSSPLGISGGGLSGGNTIKVETFNTIYAMDSQSFQQFLEANPDSLSAGTQSAVQKGYSLIESQA